MPAASPRRRSRSRSPRNTSSRSTRGRETKSSGPVNMLDAASVELAKNPGVPALTRSAEKITCTVPGNRGGIRDRMSGYTGNAVRRVSMRGSIIKPEATPMNRKERRAALMQRLSRTDDSHSHRDDEEDERRNGSFREANKPVQRLVDPTYVPKSRAFFDHDDREGGEKWKGRSLYNPQIDFGPRHNRHRSSWEGFGDRRDRDRDRYDRRDRRDHDDDRRRSSYSDRRRESYQPRGEKGGSDGLWTHDKFLELEDDQDTKKVDTIVVDSTSKSRRRVSED